MQSDWTGRRALESTGIRASVELAGMSLRSLWAWNSQSGWQAEIGGTAAWDRDCGHAEFGCFDPQDSQVGEYEFFSVSSPNTSNMASNFPNYPYPSCPVFVRLTLLQSVAVEASRFACCCCCWWPRSSRFPFFLVPDMWFTFISEVSVCSERSKSISLRSMGPFWSCVGWYSVDGLACSISWEAVTTLIVQF